MVLLLCLGSHQMGSTEISRKQCTLSASAGYKSFLVPYPYPRLHLQTLSCIYSLHGIPILLSLCAFLPLRPFPQVILYNNLVLLPKLKAVQGDFFSSSQVLNPLTQAFLCSIWIRNSTSKYLRHTCKNLIFYLSSNIILTLRLGSIFFNHITNKITYFLKGNLQRYSWSNLKDVWYSYYVLSLGHDQKGTRKVAG